MSLSACGDLPRDQRSFSLTEFIGEGSCKSSTTGKFRNLTFCFQCIFNFFVLLLANYECPPVAQQEIANFSYNSRCRVIIAYHRLGLSIPQNRLFYTKSLFNPLTMLLDGCHHASGSKPEFSYARRAG